MPEDGISVNIEAAFERDVRAPALKELAAAVVGAEGIESDAELSIVVTDDETIRDLNRRYRDRDEPTDVLSFGLEDEQSFPIPPGARRQLGEVVISYPTAQRQAEEAGRDVQAELLHLVVHGVLHILGYDHEEPEEERVMREKEESVLQGWQH